MKSALIILCLSLSATLAAPKGPNTPSIHKQKTREAPVQSPTKYGFVPQRTAASYAAKYQVRQQYEQYPAASQQQYVQPEPVQYQPEQSYDQYENAVQYVNDNSLQEEQPQYYYVQQDAGVDSKALQYVTFVPSTIPQYEEPPQLPPVTTTVAKYTSAVPAKQQYTSQKEYLTPPPQYNVHDDYSGYRREPKSLLDSYVPSYIQLQYLRQQGKSIGYTKF